MTAHRIDWRFHPAELLRAAVDAAASPLGHAIQSVSYMVEVQ